MITKLKLTQLIDIVLNKPGALVWDGKVLTTDAAAGPKIVRATQLFAIPVDPFVPGNRIDLAAPVAPGGMLEVFRNGLNLSQGIDYTVSADNVEIQLVAGQDFAPGDLYKAVYEHVA